MIYPERNEMWKCPHCGKPFDTEARADHCLFEHIKERCINHDFNNGHDLGYIKRQYGIFHNLEECQENITKDNCFIISYLQCCDKPAYRISHISNSGVITVSGCGSWSGYFSSEVRLGCLKDPRPKEELFIDPRYANRL